MKRFDLGYEQNATWVVAGHAPEGLFNPLVEHGKEIFGGNSRPEHRLLPDKRDVALVITSSEVVVVLTAQRRGILWWKKTLFLLVVTSASKNQSMAVAYYVLHTIGEQWAPMNEESESIKAT